MVSSSLFNHRSSSIFSLLVCHVVVQESGELVCRPPHSPSRTWSALLSPQPPVSCRPTTQTSGNERVNCWDTQLTASRRDPYSKSRPPRSTPLLPALPPAHVADREFAVPGGADEAEDQIAPGDLGEDGRDSPGKGGPSEEC